jgi:hypothetical protein
MKLKTILLIIVNIFTPFITYCLIFFFIIIKYGSGMIADNYAIKYGKYWEILYAISGVIQLILVYKYINLKEIFKYILMVLIVLIYVYIYYDFW